MQLFASAAIPAPEWSYDCLNVVPSSSGSLEKVRKPTDLSTPAIPALIGMGNIKEFQTPLYRQLIAAFGTDIYQFDLDAYTPTLISSAPQNNARYSFVVANQSLFMANGLHMARWDGAGILHPWGISVPAVPAIAASVAGALTLVTGRQYRASYKNSVTGHVSSASNTTLTTGPKAAQRIPVTVAPSGDGQVDTTILWATIDGGGEYYFHSEIATNGATFQDETLDANLDKSVVAPLINSQPPTGKYLCKWQGRIFVGNLVGAPYDVAYSGYERILVGRPEESFPPRNRLRLAIGSDEIRGIGALPAGIVVFSKTNEMFMLRGSIEDNTLSAPVQFTAFLEELPWKEGACAHETIRESAIGLIWLAADRQVKVFDGASKPYALTAQTVTPILKRITPGTEENCRAQVFNYLERDWYALVFAIDGSSQLNRLMIFDLHDNPDRNTGAFLFDVGQIDALEVVEDSAGGRKLVIMQGGIAKDFKALPYSVHGIAETISSDVTQELGAYWRSGYFGNEEPNMMKIFRWLRLVTDQGGFRIKKYLVDDERSTFRDPEIVDFIAINDGRHAVNKKSKRASYEIRFPDEDCTATVLELQSTHKNLSER